MVVKIFYTLGLRMDDTKNTQQIICPGLMYIQVEYGVGGILKPE